MFRCGRVGDRCHTRATKRQICSRRYFNANSLLSTSHHTSSNFLSALIPCPLPISDRSAVMDVSKWARHDNVRPTCVYTTTVRFRVRGPRMHSSHSLRIPYLSGMHMHESGVLRTHVLSTQEGDWKTIVSCFLRTEPLLKYQTTGLT